MIAQPLAFNEYLGKFSRREVEFRFVVGLTSHRVLSIIRQSVFEHKPSKFSMLIPERLILINSLMRISDSPMISRYF